jgi:hypothetical protein
MKIESNLTASDLICFINSTKEMLILGFEVEIPGIGYLHFEPGNILRFSGKNIYKKNYTERLETNSGWHVNFLALTICLLYEHRAVTKVAAFLLINLYNYSNSFLSIFPIPLYLPLSNYHLRQLFFSSTEQVFFFI